MKLLIALVLFTSLHICKAQDSSFPKKLNLNGLITVHIKSVPRLHPIQVKLTTHHSFPRSDVTIIQDSLSTHSRELYLVGPVRTLGRSTLHIADSTYEVVGAPGDTIEISILSRNDEGHRQAMVSFDGKDSAIQQYYQAKVRVLNDPIQMCMNEGMSSANLIPFQKKMDETYMVQHKFWENYQKNHDLPSWFRTYETNVLNYSDAWLRTYMIWYQTDYQKKKQVIPDSYYAFKSRIKVKNEDAMYQYEYLRFVRQYLSNLLRTSKKNVPSDNMQKLTKRELGDAVGPFVELWKMSKPVDNPNLMETRLRQQFPARFQYLVDYIRDRATANTELLKPGDKAPNFALTDSNDSLINLSRFRGQIVYLSFWFTTCGPCIKEIPYENKLVEIFKDRPVKIISICTPTPGANDDQQIAKWKAATERFGLKTIDLFSNRSWTKALTKKYFISAYPHYVLIDADGNIIENFADRPSQGVASKIEKALADINK
jgi:peroxiredoxin